MARRQTNPDGESLVSRQRGGADIELDITPMIDVTFLLLIFFMVTSTMQADANLDVPTAKKGVGIEANSALIIIIRYADPPTIQLDKDNEASKTEDPEDVGPYVREKLESGVRQVIIKAERQVPHGFVQQVTRQAHQRIKEYDDAGFSIAVEDKP